MPRYLLSGGDVITEDGVISADILINGETIEAVSARVDSPDVERVDVSGLTIFPGLVDVHVHLREPGGEHKEDFYSGTCAALAGGVTTVLAMPNTTPPLTDRASYRQVAALAEEKSVCDVGFYVGATPGNAQEAAAMIDQATAMKIYIGSSTGNLLVDDFASQITHFEAFPRDRVIAVHAEDEAAVQYYAERGQRRPSICAALAVGHTLTLAEHTDHRLHICHVSTGRELELIRDAKARGVDVTCEVAPHHLFMTDDAEETLGPLAKVNPPLRDEVDTQALWAMRDVIDMVATDHAPHTLEEKRSDAPPSGMPGLETSLPLLLTKAHDGTLTLPDIARWMAAFPAERFGLTRKGRIAPGFDADLTLVALNETWVIRNENLLTRCGWSPFAGKTVQGRIKQVYLRGNCVLKDGDLLAQPGDGKLIS